MFPTSRIASYVILMIAGGSLFFANLGVHSLWEIDETHNAECAREMMDANNWRVPTFNFQLRTDKPALLYWLMILAYKWFGVCEFAARFWSAACGLGSMLITYELGRKMFDSRTGLLAGIVLGSSLMFCVSSHAATPDALLIFFTLATFCIFWHGYAAQNSLWLIGVGVTMALAVLAKGAVGFVLPVTAMGLFLIWERRLQVLLDWKLLVGLVVYGLIAFPWYIVVGIETKWEFLRGFFFKHHFERFRAPMEGHDGFLLYHPLVFLASFAPWSAFLGLTVWFGFGRRAREDRVAAQDRETRKQGDKGTMQTAAPISLSPCPLVPLSPSSPYRFLWCWFLLWMVFFSIAGTKLPNYLLPAFPAFAILTARFLVRWQAGQIQIHPAWMTIALGCLGFVGLVTTVILLTAAGAIPNISLRGRELPEVGWLVWIGLVPLAAAAWAGWCLWKQRRSAAVTAVAMGSVAFVSLVAALVPVAVDQRKAPRVLAREMAANQEGREVQIGCFASYQPGLVYYSRRKVDWLKSPDDVVDWIHSPVQTYLVIPEDAWGSLQSQVERPYRVVARQRDFMTGKDMLLITNLPPAREIVKSE